MTRRLPSLSLKIDKPKIKSIQRIGTTAAYLKNANKRDTSKILGRTLHNIGKKVTNVSIMVDCRFEKSCKIIS